MASMMSSFTSADRRKKVVTYGKRSRPSIIPTPPPDISEEPPSPDRPRKTVARKFEASKNTGGALNSAKTRQDTRAITKELDIFDVPSDDEFTFRPKKHAKKPSKQRIIDTDLPAPVVDTKPTTRIRKEDHGHTSQSLPKPTAVKSDAPNAKPVRKAERLPAPVGEASQAPKSTIAPASQRARTPQSKQEVKKAKAVEQPVANNKTMSRAATPAASVSKHTKQTSAKPATALKKAAFKPSAKLTDNVDVYDMPPSDDEVVVPSRKPLRLGRVPGAKDSANQAKQWKAELLRNTAESDDSNTSRKRKRRGSISSVATSKASIERKPDVSAPQRRRKLQRKEDGVSSGYDDSRQSSMAPSQPRPPIAVPVINKPKRTRQLTVPVFSQRTLNKGQSSPAQLSGMVLATSVAKPRPISEATESHTIEDESMYDIPNPLTTPVRPARPAVSGSVTPRQKELFSSLLGDSSSRTPMPSLASLTLTERKPRSLLGALSRSKSDLTCSAQARKTRLIDTLKEGDASSDEEEDIDVSDNESETSSTQSLSDKSTSMSKSRKRVDRPEQAQLSSEVHAEAMDIEPEPAVVESQLSQATSTFGSRAKFTYAKTRSYLEEANPEDAFLLDDDLGLGLQTKDGLSGEDEESVSQVQATHVLKSKGQQNAFNDDVRMYIDDLPVASGNSVRRSAILELCSRMKDEAFINQLLDSTLANTFFGNINSNGEVIFDVVAAVVVTYILQASSTGVVLDQIYRTRIIPSLLNLTSNNVDIVGIAKNRKSNLSGIAIDSVKLLHEHLRASSIWSDHASIKFTPRILALKALESIVVGLRRSGSVETILDQGQVSILIDVASETCAHIKDGVATVEDTTALQLVVSILESVSTARQKQSLWSAKILEHLAKVLPAVLGLQDASSTTLTVKLCMNLTNNKPKACLPFSSTNFVQPLVSAVINNFARLRSELTQDERTAVLETLILSLGALINLAEFNDQARSNVDDGQEMVSTLVRIFLEGSERAAKAQSMEESQSNVPVGYLTVFLGNLSLNRSIRSKVCAELPKQRLDILITKIREFVQYHEHVDSKSEQYEGAEGHETWQNYTARLMLVVEKLEETEK